MSIEYYYVNLLNGVNTIYSNADLKSDTNNCWMSSSVQQFIYAISYSIHQQSSRQRLGGYILQWQSICPSW